MLHEILLDGTDLDLPADVGALAVLLVQVGQHLRSETHRRVREISIFEDETFNCTLYFSIMF